MGASEPPGGGCGRQPTNAGLAAHDGYSYYAEENSTKTGEGRQKDPIRQVHGISGAATSGEVPTAKESPRRMAARPGG